MNNPAAHEFTTGPEIIEAVTGTPSTPSKPSTGKVDVLVAGAGTGGTITGLSRAMKKAHNPRCIVVGIDPVCPQSPFLASYLFFLMFSMQVGSVLAQPEFLNDEGSGSQYIVEGIGYDFVPDVLSRDPGTVDHWLKSTDEQSFGAVRKLMRLEGLLVGGSSGSSLGGALRWLKSEEGKGIAQTKGANVVVLLPDG